MKMETSESIKEISKALFAFQSQMSKVVKRDKNPFFKSNYAGLPSILDAIDEPLKENGLIISQMPTGDNSLTTMLIHVESGEYFKSTNDMKAKSNDPQALGSAITYNRRYTIVSMLRLNVDEDDDGNRASGAVPKPAAKPQPKEPQFPPPHANDTDNCTLINKATSLAELKAVWGKIPTEERSKPVFDCKESAKTKFK